MKKALGIPVGPRDLARLEWYEKDFVPGLVKLDWLPVIELKTDKINREEEWVHHVLAFCGRHEGARLQWHANDEFFGQIGRGLAQKDAITYLSRADWLVREHGLKIVMHFGTLNWPSYSKKTPEPILAPLDPNRFVSPTSARAYLGQLDAHVPILKSIVEYFGDPKVILGENTHLCLTGMAQYNAMQCGTPLFISWLSEQTGIGTLLDIEHYHELIWLLMRQGITDRWPEKPLHPDDFQFKVSERTGITVEIGEIPYATDGRYPGLEQILEILKPQAFHLGGTRDSLDQWGVLNAHLPIPDAKTAQDIGLDKIIQYVKANGGTMIVEANGADFWLNAGHACSPRERDDERAKRQTLMTTLELIRTMEG